MQPQTSPQSQPAPLSRERKRVWVHWLLTALVVGSLAVVLVMLRTSAGLPDKPEWPYALLVSLATASTMVALTRRLPLQNVLGAALIIAVIGGAAHALGELTDMPFGPFIFGPDAGPKLFKTLPWVVPLLWVFAILNSRGVARLILRPWRKTKSYGFWVIGCAIVLVMLFDFALDPFASRVNHYWFWTPTKFPIIWLGAPLVNFFSWAVVALLILTLVTPMLINKRPKGRSSPDYHPLGIWLGALLLFASAAALNGLWPAVAVDAGIAVITAVFAIRGAWW